MREQRTYSTDAIILKHSDLGEADRVLTLLTPYKGKIHAVAKGVRRPVSRKSGHLELLCQSRLYIAQGRNLDIITQAQTSDAFLALRQGDDIWYRTCAIYLAELVDRFIEDDTQHEDVYNLLLLALKTLDEDARQVQQQRQVGTSDPEHERDRSLLLLRYFEIYLLSCIGYEPLLRTCAHCDSELEPVVNGFTPSLGGALCPNCSQLWAQKISPNALKVLRLLQRTDWARVPRLRLDPRLHAEVATAMHGLLRYHLERELKSWSFLEMLTSLPPENK